MTEKPLIWSEHALTALRERDLPIEWVEMAVRRPDWTISDANHNDRERRYRAMPERSNRILRVVVVESAKEIRIVTAFLDRNARLP